MRKYQFCLLALAMWLLTACHSDIVYSRFSPISSGEWHKDSIKHFEVQIADTDASYRTIVYVRHTERYPYQNMWLFIGDSLHCDTIEFYLADDRGQWLGDTHSGFIEMAVLLDENRHFADTGVYVWDIRQGMRDSLLRGVTDVGLEISKNGQE